MTQLFDCFISVLGHSYLVFFVTFQEIIFSCSTESNESIYLFVRFISFPLITRRTRHNTVVMNWLSEECNTVTGCGQEHGHGQQCVFDTCTKTPIYNLQGEKNGLFCDTHMIIGMVDVKNTKCFECYRRATHNYIGMKGMYCYTHAKEDMVFVHKKKCQGQGKGTGTSCKRKAEHFFFNGPQKELYCKKHYTNVLCNF